MNSFVVAHSPSLSELGEDEIRELVEQHAATGDGAGVLGDWLDERSPIYCGRGTAAVERIRGAIQLALARAGRLSDGALALVVEDLDNSRSAYGVAAAAEALRLGAPSNPADAMLLINGLQHLRDHNDYVDLRAWGGVATDDDAPTARLILLRVLQAYDELPPEARAALQAWADLESAALHPGERIELEQLLERTAAQPRDVASRKPCCGASSNAGLVRHQPTVGAHPSGQANASFTQLEDQDGRVWRADQVLQGKPGVIVFFYTRCDNPDKCSLSIARLAVVQDQLASRGRHDAVRITAVTYDPTFDDPARMRRYVESRGLKVGGETRVMRTVTGWQEFRDFFDLRVNYVGSIVNRHRIEIYLHDAGGRVVTSLERMRWNPDEVVREAIALLDDSGIDPPDHRDGDGIGGQSDRSSSPSATHRTEAGARASAAGLALALAILPKCPICGVAYWSCPVVAEWIGLGSQAGSRCSVVALSTAGAALATQAPAVVKAG